MSKASSLIGKKVTIKAGSIVRQDAQGIPVSTSVRQRSSVVTVKHAEPARHGKTRVYWKSHGYMVSSLI